MGSEIEKTEFIYSTDEILEKEKQWEENEAYLRFLLIGGLTGLASLVAILFFLLIDTPFFKKSVISADLTHLAPSYESVSNIISPKLTQPLNVLILGIDNSGHSSYSSFAPSRNGNSDTMLLVRLIPDTNQINVLSIPRDTRVNLPGNSTNKINDANAKGGITLAKQTVSNLLSNVTIDRYIRLDTQGFIKLADALGGVEINIPKSMHYVDKTQNLYINFYAGLQTLNGQQLQEYVRFRGDELGDIGRVQRQELAVKALLRTVTKPSNLTKLPQLFGLLQENVDTDFSFREMMGFFQFLKDADRQNINLAMLPGRFSEPNEYKLSYWIPDINATAPILAKYFDVRTPAVTAIAYSPLNIGKIKLAITNTTGEEKQLKESFNLLKAKGFTNTYITKNGINNNTLTLTTQIIVQRGNIEAANAVKNALGVGEIQVSSTGDIKSDITVLLGIDFARKMLPQF